MAEAEILILAAVDADIEPADFPEDSAAAPPCYQRRKMFGTGEGPRGIVTCSSRRRNRPNGVPLVSSGNTETLASKAFGHS